MSESKKIRVITVDDHEMVRDGLKSNLKRFDDLQLVGEAANGEEAISLCAEVQVDVVLMDIVMPKMDGIEATRIIHQNYPDVRILVLSGYNEENLVHPVLAAGAYGYVLKGIVGDELAEAIRATHAGQRVIAPETVDVLVHTSFREAGQPGSAHNLSPRELEVLALMAKGLTNRKISTQLPIKYSTVKTYASFIYSKLGVSGRAEAVAFAMEHDLIK